jgi:hypothetical protein
MYHSLIRVACAPDVRLIPRAHRFAFLPLSWKDEFIFLEINSLKIVMKPRHEMVGSGTVSGSSCLLMTSSSSPGQGQIESGVHPMGEGE